MTEKKDKTRDQKAVKEPQGPTDLNQLCRWGVSFSMECIMSVKDGEWDNAYTTTKDNAPFYRKECDALLDAFISDAMKLAAKRVDWDKIDFLSVVRFRDVDCTGERYMIPPSQLCEFDKALASLQGHVHPDWKTLSQYVTYTWLCQRIDSLAWKRCLLKLNVGDPPVLFEGYVLELHMHDPDSTY